MDWVVIVSEYWGSEGSEEGLCLKLCRIKESGRYATLVAFSNEASSESRSLGPKPIMYVGRRCPTRCVQHDLQFFSFKNILVLLFTYIFYIWLYSQYTITYPI